MDELDTRLSALATRVREEEPPVARADLDQRVRHLKRRRVAVVATGGAVVVLALAAATVAVANDDGGQRVRTVSPPTTATSTVPSTVIVPPPPRAPTTAASTTTTSITTTTVPVSTTSPPPASTAPAVDHGTIEGDSYAYPYTLTWTRSGRRVHLRADFTRSSGGTGTREVDASLDSLDSIPGLLSEDLHGDWLVIGFASRSTSKMYLLLNHVDPYDVDVHDVAGLELKPFIVLIPTTVPPAAYELPVTLGADPGGTWVELNN
jgi:hypothetical protein